MNRTIINCLVLAVIIAASGCGGAVATQAPAQPVATQAPAITEIPSGSGEGLVFSPPKGLYLPSESKPLLTFSQNVDVNGISLQSVAYTLPDTAENWTITIKASPFENIQSYPYGPPEKYGGLTPVGLVEIGELGQMEPGIYVVTIDLGSNDPLVVGQLFPITGGSEYAVNFQRIPQILNPARVESSYDEFKGLEFPPDTGVSINAGGVCFVVRTDGDPAYIRYCSDSGSVLSVINNFGSQYQDLVNSILPVAERFGLQDDVQTDQIISTMEHPGRIQACSQLVNASQQAKQQVCGSDITVAPVRLDKYSAAYDDAQNNPTDGRFSVTVAAVKVLHPIEITIGVLQPGDYKMDYWFDVSNGFYAATISGFTTNEQEVTNQQIPAVPATFINADNTKQPGAQISACRIIGFCTFFQRSCS